MLLLMTKQINRQITWINPSHTDESWEGYKSRGHYAVLKVCKILPSIKPIKIKIEKLH